MNGSLLKQARREKNWTQGQVARALDVTQAYWSMAESGARPLSTRLAQKAFKLLSLPPTTLPLRPDKVGSTSLSRKRDFSADLGALGYPGFAYLAARNPRNPALVLFEALNQPNLDARVAEGLPWLAVTYTDMDWNWLVRNAKVHNRQNRLGFAVSLAYEFVEVEKDRPRTKKLQTQLATLESARLAGEDTFCHDSLTRVEREWLRGHRSPVATHWNLLTDLKREHLAY